MMFPWLSRILPCPPNTGQDAHVSPRPPTREPNPHQRLAEALRAQANAARCPAPSQQASRITQELNTTAPHRDQAAEDRRVAGWLPPLREVFRTGTPRIRWLLPAAGAAALAVVALQLWMPSTPDVRKTTFAEGLPDRPWPEEAAQWGGGGFWTQGASLAQVPLEREARLAAEDSRQLLIAMAQDVLPEPAANRVIERAHQLLGLPSDDRF